MLEDFFERPTTVDRIRASWLGSAIDRYVDWLSGHGYAVSNVTSRVPMLIRFGAFAQAHGAKQLADLPVHVDPFVEVPGSLDRIIDVRRERHVQN